MRPIWFALGTALSFAFGLALGTQADTSEQPTPPPRAYLIASWNTLRPDELKPFLNATMPLAQRAGLKGLASNKPVVLEGEWPYPGVVIVQEYASMQALLDFWHSADHASAKKLREGKIESHFVVAVEARR